MFAKNSRKDRTAWKHSINHLMCSPRLSQLVRAVPSCRANSWLPLTGHHHTRGFLWAAHRHNPLCRLMSAHWTKSFPADLQTYRTTWEFGGLCLPQRTHGLALNPCLSSASKTSLWLYCHRAHKFSPGRSLPFFQCANSHRDLEEKNSFPWVHEHRAEGRQVPPTRLHHSFAH